MFRIVNDGVRDLGDAGRGRYVLGHDGGVWAVHAKHFRRLGDDTVHETSRPWPDKFEVAADGTVWTLEPGRRNDVRRIRSYDGESWRTHKDVHRLHDGLRWEDTPKGRRGLKRKTRSGVLYLDMTLAPDGTVWATWPRWKPGPERYVAVVAPLGPDGWDFDRASTLRGGCCYDLSITSDGELWAQQEDVHSHLTRRDEARWEPFDTYARYEVAPDGTVLRWGVGGLQRFDESGVPAGSILPPISPDGYERQATAFAPDGAVWTTEVRLEGTGRAATVVDGRVSRFDGLTGSRFLEDFRAIGLGIRPNGSAWLRATPLESHELESWGLYVITPEAVAAAE